MKKLLLIACMALAFAGHAEARKKSRPVAPVPFSAQSFLIADRDGTVLKEKESDQVRPIASISKLMVALLTAEQDLDESLPIPSTRSVQSSIPKKLDKLSRRELLTLALVKSDNFAAQILCENLPNCVESMNAKAAELGMEHTTFVEPTGLSRENTSTAVDLLKLMIVASNNEVITQLSSLPKAEIAAEKKTIKVKNTNPLTNTLHILLSKTGYTNPAGGCLVMLVDSPAGQRFMILLGSRNAKTRIPDMVKLYKDL